MKSFILIFFIISLASCELKVIDFPEAQKTMEVNAHPGDEIDLLFKGNPTTGYGWYLENLDEINSSVIRPLNVDETNGGDYIQDENKEGLVGVGGTFIFKFRATRSSNGEYVPIKFAYKRPWESFDLTTAVVNVRVGNLRG